MPLARRAAARAAASTESSKSIVPTTSERLAGSATNGVATSLRLGPAVEAAGGVGGALDAPVEAAVAEHPLDLVGEQQQGRQRRRVVGLLLARVLERGLQREEGRLPAAGGAVELLDAGDRGRAEQRQPEAAVGAEGLLRGEVVGVGVGDVDRQAAGARGGVDQDQGVAGVGGALRPATMTPVEVSLWAQAMHVGGGVGDRARARRRARPRPRSGRRGRARRRSPWRTSARTRRR